MTHTYPPWLADSGRATAVFSNCEEHGEGCSVEACLGRPYRYLLRWPTGLLNDRVCLFVLANPSKATADKPDPTVTRCIAYGRKWGFGWTWVVNARAYRATDPKIVPTDPRGFGPENDDYVSSASALAELVVCGWGLLGKGRGPKLLELIRAAGKVPHALRLTEDGSPWHPLYLPKTLTPFPMVLP
jgi:hypothetical protein